MRHCLSAEEVEAQYMKHQRLRLECNRGWGIGYLERVIQEPILACVPSVQSAAAGPGRTSLPRREES